MISLPYRSFNQHLRERFGCRVHRVAIDGNFTCPNIDGTRGRGGCHFCDVSGSLAAYGEPSLPFDQQLRRGMQLLQKRAKAEKFIAYFQSFTATHEKPERLRELLDQALAVDDRIVGLAVGARADCLDEPILDVLQEFDQKTYLWVDAGLESTNDATLAKVNRLCTGGEFIEAMRRAKSQGLRICAHVIYGLPGDSDEDMLRSIEWVNDLGLDGVKIHNLYIDSHSAYGALWQRGQIPIMDRDHYIDLVCQSISRLDPRVLIHRLTGEAPRGRHLAPDWAANKQALLAAIHDALKTRGVIQGQCRSGFSKG